MLENAETVTPLRRVPPPASTPARPPTDRARPAAPSDSPWVVGLAGVALGAALTLITVIASHALDERPSSTDGAANLEDRVLEAVLLGGEEEAGRRLRWLSASSATAEVRLWADREIDRLVPPPNEAIDRLEPPPIEIPALGPLELEASAPVRLDALDLSALDGDREEVETALAGQLDQLGPCVAVGDAGALRLRLALGDGAVREATVLDTTLTDPQSVGCALATVRGWTAPAGASGSAEVRVSVAP